MDEQLQPVPGEQYVYNIISTSEQSQPTNEELHQEPAIHNQPLMSIPEFPIPLLTAADVDVVTQEIEDPPNLMAYQNLELQLMLQDHAEDQTELLDYLDISHHQNMQTNNTTTKPWTPTPLLVPQPDTLVQINLPTFIGDTAVVETTRYQNLETRLMLSKLQESQTLDFLNQSNIKCSTCWTPLYNPLNHHNRGPFAENHQFSRIDEHLKIEILFYSTLRQLAPTTVEGIFDTSVTINPHLNPAVSQDDIEKLMSNAKTVPTTIREIIAKADPIFPCGEHYSTYPSKLSLALHYVTVPHTYHSHVCFQCREIVPESFLLHNHTKHGKKLAPNLHRMCAGPYLYEIFDHNCKSQDGYLSEPFTSTILTINQLTEIQSSRSNQNILVKTIDLYKNMPIRSTTAYINLKELFPSIESFNKLGCSTSAYPLNIQEMLKIITLPTVLKTALLTVQRLTENKPTYQTTETFMKTGRFEVLTLLYLARLCYEFHNAEREINIPRWKTGKTKIHQIQLYGPASYAENPNRLKELNLTNYSAITIGTKTLKKSGITSMTRHRFVNLSPTTKTFLATSSFENLGYYPGFVKQITIPPESMFINHVSKVIESTSSIPIIVEFNLNPNLDTIDPKLWNRYIQDHTDDYILNFCLRLNQIRTRNRAFQTKPRDIIILGQTVLFHPKLSLPVLIELTDRINLSLQIITLVMKIPLVLPAGMIGYTGTTTVPLVSTPKEPMYHIDGSLTDYSISQGARLLFLIMDGLQLLNDVTLEPSFRSHMVT